MLVPSLLTAGSLLALVAGQTTDTSSPAAAGSSTETSSLDSTSGYIGVPTGSVTDLPTGPYISYASTITLSSSSAELAYGSMSSSSSSSMASNTTQSSNVTMSSTSSTSTDSQTLLGGTVQATSTMLNGTSSTNATSTSTAPTATNTQPCNSYAEFCGRKYSNITYVAAHNSAFDVTGNAASNQKYGSIAQLNDGIRLLQTETHWPNSSAPYLCHTSCDILNVGTLESWLTNITAWVAAHPYDVVTLIVENQDYKPVTDYLPSFQNSGIMQYVYTPSQVPMTLDDWPTLSYMILMRQRVVVFMDYEANQTAIPWILDEFSQVWETPFNPTTQDFPCTIQRPPGLSNASSEERMYLLNNNLNTEITLLGESLLVPTTTLLNVTNAANASEYGTLGRSALQCYNDWGRAPNFLDVDYYNVGSGSVFEVAARWNNVTYNATCCGLDATVSSMAGRTMEVVGRVWVSMAVLVVMTTWLLT